MPSWFNIIQYVPNPISDERINIGVVVFGESIVKVKFTENWKRVQCFAGGNTDFLKDFVAQAYREIPAKLSPLLDEPNSVREEAKRMLCGWINSIQITEPRGSLKTPDVLIEDVYEKFIFDPIHIVPIRRRGRQAAKQITISSFRKALERFNKKELLNINYAIPGRRFLHEFDAVAANGAPYFAAHSVSFEVNEPKDLLDALAWRIEDIKEHNSSFPVGIVTLQPIPQSPNYQHFQSLYERTSEIYQELGAEIVAENEAENWVSRHIQEALI